MNPQRKRIIISEIKYWKQNKLLPGHYCDFLITLYTQGEEENEQAEKVPYPILVEEKRKMNRKVMSVMLLALLTIGSLFFFSHHPGITLGIASATTLLFISLTFRKSWIQTSIVPFLYISSSFILLAMSLKLWLVFFEGNNMLLIGLLLLNCILWLFAGRLLKLLYFTISGAAGLLLTISYLLF
ncbi:hypothetical protein FITA111629_04735 [Filibacter tadaridae]|uniref:Uncharacterized protein n=1 Tax=Filibacter tadaridae TaxID=2483811 RepID=A0A3P5XWD6_9BACL|nr:hypothetical protein [Filibacter tadaridae]VDC32457.1 hypothetical protein FILTAD_02685 [Filibacter tadaridae]